MVLDIYFHYSQLLLLSVNTVGDVGYTIIKGLKVNESPNVEYYTAENYNTVATPSDIYYNYQVQDEGFFYLSLDKVRLSFLHHTFPTPKISLVSPEVLKSQK
mmetsp:Transcript_39141/g.34828  ORF Transcript_39141/g.34828 Transcript_39141/m.34828 type:complete len:102 (+) Transcript_39141:1665-1970(+)